MRKSVKIIALAAVLAVTAMLSGCGEKETEVVNKVTSASETTIAATEAATEVTTEAATEITTEVTTEVTTETTTETTTATEYNYEQTDFYIGELMIVNDGGYTAEVLGVYDYGTTLTFRFAFTATPSDIEKAWNYAKKYSEEMLGIDDYESITTEECGVKLIVDGEVVPLISSGEARPMEVNVYISEINVATVDAGFVLTFEPIEYKNAGSVVLEIETDDGLKTINLK